MEEKFKISKILLDKDKNTEEVLFYIEGHILSDIIVGNSVSIFKTNKNGLEEYGYFYTSAVMEITKDGFLTQNSVYKVEKLS